MSNRIKELRKKYEELAAELHTLEHLVSKNPHGFKKTREELSERLEGLRKETREIMSEITGLVAEENRKV